MFHNHNKYLEGKGNKMRYRLSKTLQSNCRDKTSVHPWIHSLSFHPQALSSLLAFTFSDLAHVSGLAVPCTLISVCISPDQTSHLTTRPMYLPVFWTSPLRSTRGAQVNNSKTCCRCLFLPTVDTPHTYLSHWSLS